MTRGSPRRGVLQSLGCVWPLIGVVSGLVAAGTLVGLGGFVLRQRLAQPASPPIVVRLPMPTETTTPTPTATPEATIAAVSAREDGTFLIGDVVEVSGTDGEGVRLRTAPSLEGTILGLGQDGEVYQVLDGPSEGSGFVWWKIVKLDDPTQEGWAVATFLQLLQ